MSKPIVIEHHTENGTEWLVSFDGSNPTADKCVTLTDRTEAEKLVNLMEPKDIETALRQ